MFKRIPSRRAVAAWAKLHGYRLERRWPWLVCAEGKDLNLGFEDLLEYQYSRSRRFMFLSIGAYDGLANDPIGKFARSHACRGILIEPQPDAFERLCANYRDCPGITPLNVAIDRESGTRTLYHIPAGTPGLPEWTGQLASFERAHLLKHETDAPGLSAHVRAIEVRTLSFVDLLDRHGVRHIDVLQVDAEGMDARLLGWFPFERLRPAILHYETAHMTATEKSATRTRIETFGYRVREADSATDDMAWVA